MNDLIPLAKLYERTSGKGQTYWSGFLGDARIVIFQNRDHDPNDPKSPSHLLFIGPKSNGQTGNGQSTDANKTKPASAGTQAKPPTGNQAGTRSADRWPTSNQQWDASGRRIKAKPDGRSAADFPENWQDDDPF